MIEFLEWKGQYPPEAADLTDGEICAIRETFFDLGQNEEPLPGMFQVTEQTIEAVLQGEVKPLAGGRLKRMPMTGVHLDNGYTSNQRKFIKGVLALAKEKLGMLEYNFFCEANSYRPSEVNELTRKVDITHEGKHAKFYRNSICRHTESVPLEKAISSTRRKRKPKSRSSALS